VTTGYPKTKSDPTPQYVLIDGSRNVRKLKLKGLTTAQRDALDVGSNDRVIIYNNTTTQFEKWEGSSWAALGGASINTGNYTGDDTADRAIAHGLGTAPSFVFLLCETIGQSHWFYAQISGSNYIYFMHPAASGKYSVSAIDSTNFHVGNASDYGHSANYNGRTYYWVAIG